MIAFKNILAGSGIGIVNGLLGGGGGMIAVPALRGTGLSQKRAHATAIAVVLPASIASAFVYLLRGALPFKLFLPVVLGTVLGGFLGAKLLKATPKKWVGALFAAVMLAAGVKSVIG